MTLEFYDIDATVKFWEATRINGASASMADTPGVDHRLVEVFDMIRDMVIKHPLRSMDSAPKDGSLIMIWDKDDLEPRAYWVDGGDGGYWSSGPSVIRHPKGWMPRPDVP